MKFRAPPKPETLSILRYDPIGGGIYVTRSHNRRVAGARVDKLGTDGYRHVRIDGILHKAHRLAWVLFYGALPEMIIDHKNLDKSDNSIENLRLATYEQNSANMKGFGRHAKGTTRIRDDRFQAQIQVGGKHIRIGFFKSEAEAAAAYRDYASKVFGEFARFDK